MTLKFTRPSSSYDMHGMMHMARGCDGQHSACVMVKMSCNGTRAWHAVVSN